MPSRPFVALSLAALLTVAACGGPGETTDPPTARPTAAATTDPAPTDPADPTEAPPETEEPAPTDEPTEEPTPTEDPDPSGGASGDPTDPAAAACTGNDQNREFFASIAAAVDWPVLCLADDGWFVTTGSYSLRGGGRLEIGYRGPGGATVELSEGYICDGAGCAPAGTPLGDVALGALGNAQLIDVGGGSFAIVVDPDANPSWILVSNGMSADDLADLGAGFATVGG